MDGEKERKMELNQALEMVGGLGLFQAMIFACLFGAGAIHGARMTSGYYFLFKQQHRCYVGPTANESTKYDTSPLMHHDDGVLETFQNDTQCSINYTKCHRWVYSKSIMERTATSQYDLVCDEKLFPSHANTALMIGCLLGGIVFGKISDRYGRKLCFHLALLVFLAFGVALPWASNFYLFAVMYGITGAATNGLFTVSIVTAMEFVLPQNRMIPVLLMTVFFSLGEIFMTGVAYGTRDWHSISLAITVPAVLLILNFWVVPESIKWLMLHKKYKELNVVLERMAKINGKQPLPVEENNEEFEELLKSFDHGSEYKMEQARDSFFHMFKHCNLAQRVIFTCFNWFVVNLAYFTLVYNSKDLGKGLFMNFFYGAIVEAPAHFLSLVLVDRIGRKYLHCGYYLLMVIVTIIATVVCFCVNGHKWVLLLMTVIGKFCAAGLMGTSFLWMTELYPTSVRSVGLGVGAASARIGAIISAYIIDWESHLDSRLGHAIPYLTVLVMGVLAFLACLSLPETRNRDLPGNIKEARRFGRNQEADLIVPNAQVNTGGYGALINVLQ